jgi:hypothetical protein
LAALADLGPDRDGVAQAQERRRAGDRSRGRTEKKLIERAYREAEASGIQLWGEDEAGPYQAIPRPGPSWQPAGEPARPPHESVRGGTPKLLPLFRPATGAVRARPTARATNAELHPWLKEELTAILAQCPPAPATPTPGRRWSDGDDPPDAPLLDAHFPPVRLLLLWDTLRGHLTPSLVQWLGRNGIVPLSTPLGGSWLNLTESIQRIIVRRALAGQHPQSAQEVLDWLAATVNGWNADPTPFVWGGRRAARRQRARERRHALGGSAGYTRRPIARRSHSPFERYLNGKSHAN